MNLTNLKYFYDVSILKSTNEAAKRNHVSQPAISQGIKKLENELELPLLNHKRNSIELTPAGHSVAEKAKALFQSVHAFENEIERIKSTSTGKISIGISNSLVPLVLTPILKKFTKAYPRIDIEIKIGKTDEQIDMLKSGIIDFAITIDHQKIENFPISILKKGNFSLYGLKNCPLQILQTEKRPETVNLHRNLKLKDLNKVIQIESWATILNLTKSNYGIGLLPDFLVKNENLIDYSKKWKKGLKLSQTY